MNKCCAIEIRALWAEFGPEGISGWKGNCATCGQFIGLTSTPISEANRFLKSHNLAPFFDPGQMKKIKITAIDSDGKRWEIEPVDWTIHNNGITVRWTAAKITGPYSDPKDPVKIAGVAQHYSRSCPKCGQDCGEAAQQYGGPPSMVYQETTCKNCQTTLASAFDQKKGFFWKKK